MRNDEDQISLFDMFDEDNSMLLSSESDFISVEEYEAGKRFTKPDEDKAVEEPKIKEIVEVIEEPKEVSVPKTTTVEKPADTSINKTKGIMMTVKKPFAAYNEGDTLGLVSFIIDNSGLIRTMWKTESGALISMTYSSMEEYKKTWG